MLLDMFDCRCEYRGAQPQLTRRIQKGKALATDSRTGQPFKERRFQKNWRAVARAAGIPDDVMNRDSRACGVTEGSDAGADLVSTDFRNWTLFDIENWTPRVK